MLEIAYRTKFKKELNTQKNRGRNLQKFKDLAKKLANQEKLDPKHHNHKLTGNFDGRWECHIEPDWLLVYRRTDTEIIFERTGSHSDLFK